MFSTSTKRGTVGALWALACALFALVLTSCAKHYPVEGLVLRVDRARNTLLVSHNEIPGYMPAMTMPFRVAKPAQLETLTPGTRVEFQLSVSRRGASAHNLHARVSSPDGVVEDNGSKLRLPPTPRKLPIGAAVPDFTLTDHLSRPVHLSDFRGKIVAVDFIYTRCPLPEVCPRLSAGFARLQKRFAGKNLVLLSVTLDPQYDVPDVLSRYARIWKAKPEAWRFLTGDLAEIHRVAGDFGLISWPEEGLLTHSSQTAVIARDGKLIALLEGSGYAANQLGDLIALELESH